MGIKKLKQKFIKKRFLFVILTVFILFLGFKTFAQVPKCPCLNEQLVRVAITGNSFKPLTYNQISIIATADYALYYKNSARQIVKFDKGDIADVQYKYGKFTIKTGNKIVARGLKGTLVFDCPTGLLGVEYLQRKGKQALYHGTFELTPKNDCRFFLVNVLSLQNYLRGVVPNEMPAKFGLEALKAQAVAARNYVLMPRNRAFEEFDVDDSVSSQVYFGANTEEPLTNLAVLETEGLVALNGWDLILAQYSSTAGGYTESYENVFSEAGTKFPSIPRCYLKGKPDVKTLGLLNREEEARLFYMSCPDSYDIKSPYYRWQREWNVRELEKTLKQTLAEQSATGFVQPEFKKSDELGNLKEIKVAKRGLSGKIIELEIITDEKIYHIFKELVIRRLLKKDGKSLPSANVVFDNLYDSNNKLYKIQAYGGGYGHGVGMSQYGAGFMSTVLNKKFDEILKRYYSEITISTVPVILSSNEGQKIVTQRFFASKKLANIVIDNKYKIDKINAKINGKLITLELKKGIMPKYRVIKIDISENIKKGKNEIIFYFPEQTCDKALRLYVELVGKDEG